MNLGSISFSSVVLVFSSPLSRVTLLALLASILLLQPLSMYRAIVSGFRVRLPHAPVMVHHGTLYSWATFTRESQSFTSEHSSCIHSEYKQIYSLHHVHIIDFFVLGLNIEMQSCMLCLGIAWYIRWYRIQKRRKTFTPPANLWHSPVPGHSATRQNILANLKVSYAHTSSLYILVS